MTGESTRILLVIHDPLESAKLANSLSNFGCEIISCQEIEGAEALFPQLHPHVLITDLSFPPLFGGEGIKLIQKMKLRFPDMVAIGITEAIEEKIELLFRAAKGNSLFPKPVFGRDILDYLRQNKELQFQFSNVPGRVKNIARLEDFLRTKSVSSLLQPIVGIRKDNDSQILGVESLARPESNHTLWNPEMLFEYAHKVEKTFEADRMCIEAALKEAKELSPTIRLFLNVRPYSIAQDEFSEYLTTAAGQFGFEPSQIVIELTEQQTIENHDKFNRTLAQLREKGFGFALDDFGAGYANLERLSALRPDYLKISGIFSRNLDTDSAKQVIVKSSAQLARRLNIPTILENIETKKELEKAKSLGVDYGQGYYFFHPKSAKKLKELIPGFHPKKSLA